MISSNFIAFYEQHAIFSLVVQLDQQLGIELTQTKLTKHAYIRNLIRDFCIHIIDD